MFSKQTPGHTNIELLTNPYKLSIHHLVKPIS